MPPAAASIAHAARTEWAKWGSGTWNCRTGVATPKRKIHLDDDPTWANYVLQNYVGIFAKNPSTITNTTAIADDDYYCSAVAISFIMRAAGFAKSDFPISQSHSTYIRWSVKAKKAGNTNVAYWGYRVDDPTTTPDVGDLIGYAHGSKASAALNFYDKTGSYSSHSDVVVAKRAGEIDVIGGNVRDSVTLKTLAIASDGRLADTTFPWFVVMKKRL